MLLEIAVADAYGVGFEYRPQKFVVENNHLKQYFPHERYKKLFKKYSDDTQMSIGVFELMLEYKHWTDELIAEKFLEVFKRDIRFGYSSGFYSLLLSVNTGEELINKLKAKSDRSGAAMRSGAIGVYSDINELLQKSMQQAKLTHDTLGGISSSQASSLMVHFFVYKKGEKKYLGEYIQTVIGGDWASPWTTKVGEKGYMSVRAAITAICRNDDMASLLRDCISFTGDVDTVATIAIGAACFCPEIRQNLPKWLFDELENGAYGKIYLENLDARFFELFKLP